MAPTALTTGAPAGCSSSAPAFSGEFGACVGTPVDLATPHKELVVTYRWQPSRARTLKVGPRIDRTSLGVAATLGF
jgi:hypothetical protein